MRRRSLIMGAAASLITGPAVAAEWEGFQFPRGGSYQPRWWTQPHRSELDPHGKLTPGLVMLLQFDAGCLRPGGIQNKVKAVPLTFTFDGTTQALTPTPFGGMALSTGSASTDDILAGTFIMSAAAWTLSSLIKFDGTGGGAGNLVLVGDANAPVEYITSTGTNFKIADSVTVTTCGSPTITSLVGWTRFGIVATNTAPTTYTLYVNGVAMSTTNSTGNNGVVGMASLINGWQWPVADMFLWNYAMPAAAMAAHAADPYGTVLRPRWSALNVKGLLAAAGKKPSLLTTGAGP
jgi:hypothetical protein